MLRYKDFTFDPRTGSVRRGLEPIALRPKSTLLLAHLLAHPDDIQRKRELMVAVWGHDRVEDQALFQLISEIRSALGDKNCILTYPNRGYCWGWPTRAAVTRNPGLEHGARLAMVAAAVLVVVVAWQSRTEPRAPAGPPQALTGMSPALTAVAEAVQARASGDLARAVSLLEVAVEANPHFAAAKLELADALRDRGELERAQGLAYDALSDARIVGDHYLEATANVLLSKLRLLDGDLSGALRANAEAARIADEHDHVCAAQVSAAWQQQLTLALTQPELAAPAESAATVAACQEALKRPQSLLSGSDFGGLAG